MAEVVVGTPGFEVGERQRVLFQPREIHSGSVDTDQAAVAIPEVSKLDAVAVGGPVREKAGPLELPKQHTHLLGVSTPQLIP